MQYVQQIIELNEMYEQCFPHRAEAMEKNLSPKEKDPFLPRQKRVSLRKHRYLKNPGICQDSIYTNVSQIPFPIARRLLKPMASNGDCQSGSSPGSRSSLFCAFPRFPSVTSCRFAPCYSGGTAPVLHRSSLLSLATPDPIDMKFYA